MSERRRIAITGMGATTPFGAGLGKLWAGVQQGRSTSGPITIFDPGDIPVRFACEVPGVDERGPGFRAWRFAAEACDEAVADAGLPGDLDAERVGLSYAVGSFAPETAWFADEIETALEHAKTHRELLDNVYQRVLPKHGGMEALSRGLFPSLLSGELARRCGAEGPTCLVVTSCPGSLQALIAAADAIRDGEADVAIAGGTECLVSQLGIMGFARLQALSANNEECETASRPFDRRRDGFVMGEGAGAIVLEDWEHALRRGARIRAEWLGYGLTCDAYKITDEHPDGISAAEAVRRALADAGVAPERIGYVNAHGSSTQMNDRIETKVLHATLGAHARRIPVSSTKSMIGHLIHGAAVVELATTVLALESQIVPPTANYRERDAHCDLDYVPNEPRAHDFDVALKNAFGFGGINASVVVGAAQ